LIAKFLLQRRLEHSNFKDADAASGASEAASKQSWEATEGLGDGLIQLIQRAINGGNES
jgi:hypothetical protein